MIVSLRCCIIGLYTIELLCINENRSCLNRSLIAAGSFSVILSVRWNIQSVCLPGFYLFSPLQPEVCSPSGTAAIGFRFCLVYQQDHLYLLLRISIFIHRINSLQTSILSQNFPKYLVGLKHRNGKSQVAC